MIRSRSNSKHSSSSNSSNYSPGKKFAKTSTGELQMDKPIIDRFFNSKIYDNDEKMQSFVNSQEFIHSLRILPFDTLIEKLNLYQKNGVQEDLYTNF